jgi:hypothetical protein
MVPSQRVRSNKPPLHPEPWQRCYLATRRRQRPALDPTQLAQCTGGLILYLDAQSQCHSSGEGVKG